MQLPPRRSFLVRLLKGAAVFGSAPALLRWPACRYSRPGSGHTTSDAVCYPPADDSHLDCHHEGIKSLYIVFTQAELQTAFCTRGIHDGEPG